MTSTGASKSGSSISEPSDASAPTPTGKQEGSPLSPSTEAWIERVMTAGERMQQDEDYRQEIAKRLS